jgi:hypothetical protein
MMGYASGASETNAGDIAAAHSPKHPDNLLGTRICHSDPQVWSTRCSIVAALHLLGPPSESDLRTT